MLFLLVFLKFLVKLKAVKSLSGLNDLPVGAPKVWSEIGVRALDPRRRSQSISSDLEAGLTLAQPHSSISKVQSPETPAAVCGAP